MKLPYYLAIAFVGFFTASCNQQTPPGAPPATVTESPYKDAEYSVQAILFHQFASEYRALCYQAYNIAAERLLAAKKAKPKGKLAIITDLDETVVDNSYYNTWLVNEGAMYTPETWKQWTAQRKATLIPGSLDFFNLADSLGVAIFYVSNRGVDEFEDTKANMQELGMPQLDSSRFYLKSTTSGKEARRQSVMEQGYEVVLYLGDNLNDFSMVYEKQNNDRRDEITDSLRTRFGNDFIVFPNAIYGEWEFSLYEYDYKFTPAQRDSIRKSVLKRY